MEGKHWRMIKTCVRLRRYIHENDNYNLDFVDHLSGFQSGWNLTPKKQRHLERLSEKLLAKEKRLKDKVEADLINTYRNRQNKNNSTLRNKKKGNLSKLI